MTFPIFLLLWGLLPCIQGACELKDNAVELVSVDYTGFLANRSDVTAYVDELSVKMKGGERWSSLLKDTSRASGCNVRRLKTNVYYKKKTDEEWERLGRKRMSSSDDFEIRHLNPCEVYQVKVTALTPEVTVGILEVGPYYRRDFQQEYLIDMDNEYYLTYADFPFYYINATGFEGSATISLANLCARTVAVHVYKGDINHGIEKIIDTDPETKPKQSIVMEELEPCTQYHVDLDLFLKKHLAENLKDKSDSDFFIPDIISFYTMPNSSLLKSNVYTSYNEADNILTWDFKNFFDQTCADDDIVNQVSTGFALNFGGNTSSVHEQGSQVIPTQVCDFNVELMVHYSKAGQDTEVKAFTKTIPGSNTVKDTLTLESGNIVKTVNPCEEGEVEMTAEVTTSSKPLTFRSPDNTITFPGDVTSPQPVSDVDWKGCFDFNVTMRRDERIVAEMVIPHPGWEKVLTVLELSHKTSDTITFHSPRHKCKTGKFKIEIVCKYEKEGIEGEVSTQFGFDDVIKVTNLTSETEYHCKGRLLNIEEGTKSNWSESLKITTNFVEEVAILPLEEEKEDEKEGSGPAEDSEVVEPEIMVTETVVMDIVSEEPVVEDKISEKVVLASKEAAPNEGNEEMKTANIRTIIGIVAGVLIVGIILIVIVGKKKFRTNNYQLEGTHLMDSKTDSVKVEMINCMVEDQPTENIAQIENENVKDPSEEANITVESSTEDATKTDSSTANTEDADKSVGEIVESNDNASASNLS